MDKEKFSLNKKLLLWFGSFLVVGSFLVLRYQFPIVPLAAGGLLALIITLIRHFSTKDSDRK